MKNVIDSFDRMAGSISSLSDKPLQYNTLKERITQILSNNNYQTQDLELLYFFIMISKKYRYSNVNDLFEGISDKLKETQNTLEKQYSESLWLMLMKEKQSSRGAKKRDKFSGRLGDAHDELSKRFKRLCDIGIIIKVPRKQILNNEDFNFKNRISSPDKYFVINDKKLLEEFEMSQKTFCMMVRSIIFKDNYKEILSNL